MQMHLDLAKWSHDLLEVQASLGKTSFYPRVFQLLNDVAKIDECLFIHFTANKQPQLLWQYQSVAGDNLDRYLQSLHVLDPFYRLGIDAKDHGFYKLKDITHPNDVQFDDYYNRYFRHLNIHDEAGYLFQLPNEQGFVHIEIANFAGSDKFSDDQLELFEQLFDVLNALLTEHIALSGLTQLDLSASLSFVEQFHQLFGTEVCTPREHDVMLLMLQGYSVKSIAQHLSLGMETIKMHKKNIYAKLNVGSQPELMALFIDLLVMAEGDIYHDPLVKYVAKLKAA